MNYQRERALELLRKEYENAPTLLAAKSWMKFPEGPYRDLRELVTAMSHGAGAAADFAVRMGLITPEDAADLIRETAAAHPEFVAFQEQAMQEWYALHPEHRETQTDAREGQS